MKGVKEVKEENYFAGMARTAIITAIITATITATIPAIKIVIS